MNTAYVYKWTHKPSMKWYIGSHKGHVKNYICSSKYLKEQIKLHSDEWERTIIATGDYNEMLELETEILQLFNARNDVRSFNRHNNEGCPSMMGGPLTQETKDKIGKANKGRIHYDRHGIPRSQEIKDKIKNTMTGQKYNQERRDAMKEGNKIRSTIIVECPHCGKTGIKSAGMSRYHFTNCKETK